MAAEGDESSAPLLSGRPAGPVAALPHQTGYGLVPTPAAMSAGRALAGAASQRDGLRTQRVARQQQLLPPPRRQRAAPGLSWMAAHSARSSRRPHVSEASLLEDQVLQEVPSVLRPPALSSSAPSDHPHTFRAPHPHALQLPVYRRSADCRSCELPEDAVRLLVDFAVSGLMELLAFALLDRQFHSVACKRLVHELKWHGVKVLPAGTPDLQPCRHPEALGLLLCPQVGQQFVALPDLAFRGPGVTGEGHDTLCDAFLPFEEDDALLHCQDCNTPILKVEDVISSNYRIMTGRAYLSSTAYNVKVSEDTHEANYTTGQYRVRHVSCSTCSYKLGITYVRADDHENQYKIGKFLVGQNCFVRPACCMLRSRRQSAELPMPLCPRCHRTSVRGSLQLVSIMTEGLCVGRTRQLYELLLRQEAVETLALVPGERSATRRLLSAPRALLAWCLPLLWAATLRKQQRQKQRAAGPPSGHAAEGHSRLPSSSLAPHSQSQAERLGLDPDLWQDALRERMCMLQCLGPLVLGRDDFPAALATVVSFVDTVRRTAKNSAPFGSSRPERAPLLLQLVPALVARSSEKALGSARALALAVRREWVACNSERRNSRSLTAVEMESIVHAITARAAAGVLAEVETASESARRKAGNRTGHLQLPVMASRNLSFQMTDMLAHPMDYSNDTAAEPLLGMNPFAPATPGSWSMETESVSSELSTGDSPMLDTDEEPLSDVTMTSATSTCTDELLLQCLSCGSPSLKADDIMSSDYRIMTGSAYLANAAYNIVVSAFSEEAEYSSGLHTVRDVACSRCMARLGIMYVDAEDEENQFKIGKFLLSQSQLLVPRPGSSAPKSEAALRRHLLELMQCGSGLLSSKSRRDRHRRSRSTSEPMASAIAAAAARERPRERPRERERERAAREPAPPEPEPEQPREAPVAPEEAAPENQEDLQVLVPGPAPAAPPPQRLIVTIQRYIRCMLPVTQYIHTAQTWAVSSANNTWLAGARPADQVDQRQQQQQQQQQQQFQVQRPRQLHVRPPFQQHLPWQPPPLQPPQPPQQSQYTWQPARQPAPARQQPWL
ncbi:unnamed protein product [Polarella glacialis]|uniref:Yippee domain-containing protein n=1 Tax=Polarella glacialis TaxID=89957 RepID=A0A813HXY0_POLGL|nr:unnamed protein product [Polarella glacialis]